MDVEEPVDELAADGKGKAGSRSIPPLVGCGIIVGVLFLLSSVLVGPGYVEALMHLIFGFFIFLSRTSAKMTIDPAMTF